MCLRWFSYTSWYWRDLYEFYIDPISRNLMEEGARTSKLPTSVALYQTELDLFWGFLRLTDKFFLYPFRIFPTWIH